MDEPELLVTFSVIEPFEVDFGNPMAPSESSNDVDLTPFDDVIVVVVPFDASVLCLGEFFGEFVDNLLMFSTVLADPWESKLECPLLRLNDNDLLPLSMLEGPEVISDVLPLSKLDGPLYTCLLVALRNLWGG
jgi:hypothetical protein